MNEDGQRGWARYRWIFHGVMLSAILLVVVLNLRLRSERELRQLTLPNESLPGQSASKLSDYGALPDFALTERSGQPLKLQDLRGKVWIADFIFTHCAGPCPLMTMRMSKLQESLQKNPDVRLVSFTVDPARDTPQVLSEYAANYGASRDRWFFLTGEQAAIYNLATNGFHMAVLEDASGNKQPDHSTRFVLLDRGARIRGYYDGTSEEALDQLLKDVSTLLREKQ